jgi:hypothetical protein
MSAARFPPPEKQQNGSPSVGTEKRILTPEQHRRVGSDNPKTSGIQAAKSVFDGYQECIEDEFPKVPFAIQPISPKVDCGHLDLRYLPIDI